MGIRYQELVFFGVWTSVRCFLPASFYLDFVFLTIAQAESNKKAPNRALDFHKIRYLNPNSVFLTGHAEGCSDPHIQDRRRQAAQVLTASL